MYRDTMKERRRREESRARAAQFAPIALECLRRGAAKRKARKAAAALAKQVA